MKLDKYAFVTKNARIVHAVYALGILTWLGVVYGYLRFFELNKWYWLVFGPMVLLFTLYHLISYGINLFYRAFDVRKHNAAVKAYWAVGKTEPSVDVFLPICGEDVGMLATTFAAVSKMDYANKRVYVLDDGADADAKKLAAKFGFDYLSRPDRGHMKKAGNLKYGHERSKGEFIVVFDADFAPHKDFVKELLPYMQDPKTAIVQSPQYFVADDDVHRRSPLEYGAGQTQEDFYRIIQVSRDRFNGAICVGSNAIYRRAALDSVGGTTQIAHSEDVHTGFNLVSSGWTIKYVPLVLAVGLCPDNLHAFFQQQNRWCSGSMSLMLTKEFWSAKLGLGQRLCYISGYLYYISHALSLLMAFQVFVLLFWHYDQITFANSLSFLPHILYSFVVLPLFRRTPPKYGSTVVRMAHTYTYGHAVVTNMLGQSLGWHPTNTKVRGVTNAFSGLVAFNALYFLAYVALVSYAIATHRFPVTDLNYYSVIFWVFYFLVTNGIFLWNGYRVLAEANEDAYWGARVAGSFAAIVLVLVGVGAYTARPATPVEASTVVAESAVAPVTAVSQSFAPAASLPSSYRQSYTAVAEAGDSLTTLYRKDVYAYLADRGQWLTPDYMTFVEDTLVKQHAPAFVRVGDTLTASASQIEDAISAGVWGAAVLR